MKTLKNHILFLLLFLSSYSYSQTITYYRPNSDNSVYTAMQGIMSGNETISYITLFPAFKPIEDRCLKLVDGEGKEGYILESNIYHKYILFMGRNQGNHRNQTQKITFAFGLTSRMTQDKSIMLLPTSNKAGFGYEKILFNSFNRLRPFAIGTSDQRTENFLDSGEDLHMIYYSGLVEHYSNGQPPGVYRDPLLKRNDYISGNFSTNYFRNSLIYSYLSHRRDLYTIQIGHQYDAGRGEVFNYTDEQEGSYGHHRLTGVLQLRRHFRGGTVPWTDFTSYPDRNFKLHSLWEIVLRHEFEVILDNADEFRHSKKHRVNFHVYLQLTKLQWKTLGIVLHYYRGRDYLNIRYDDIVSSFQAGLSFNLSKYMPPISDQDIIHSEF
ncbi:MAG: hypothetical protein ACI8P3_002832 [Saprospiraceae bacterium]|jgi:hypothetical protein